MNIAVLGLGYVGSVTAGYLAHLGHRVVGVDTNQTKVQNINDGRSPVVEPGLDEIIGEARANGLLRAVTEPEFDLSGCELALVCVGTPTGDDGEHDLSQVASATRAIARAVSPQRNSSLTVAYRSTFRPGTCANVIAPIFRAEMGEAANDRIEIVHHPEFLREGQAIDDFKNPSRIVIGTPGGRPCKRLEALYSSDAPKIHTVRTEVAELIKLFDNAWHATKVVYANEMGRVCETFGVSARDVHKVFVDDTKLNISEAYLKPGGPFGGSCLPKDVRALQQIGEQFALENHLIDALIPSNEAHKSHQLRKATSGLNNGAKILLVGLAFKAGTDDMRESPQLDLARGLIDAGFDLDIYDPSIDTSRLVGQNRDQAESMLPQLDSLLVSKSIAETENYARIVVAKELEDSLNVDISKVVDLCTTP